jgi:Tol biopolymer transport system component
MGMLLAAAVVATAGVVAQSSEARAQLEAARKIETVDGNLPTAIKKYQEIANRFEKTERAVAAQALLRMAECYQKLGDSQSAATYERIIRRFPDQTDAVATARSQLARTVPSARATQPLLRRIWQSTRSATPLPDGRFVSYDEDGNMVIVDAGGGSPRRVALTRPGGNDHTAGWLPSRDGSQLAYNWYTNEKNRYDLRVISLRGNTVPPARVLFDSEDQNVTYPMDWSHDGRFIAVSVSRKDRSRQIGLVSVDDGKLTVLKSGGWDSDGAILFSPDGRYLAFDQPGERGETRDVSLLALDGSRLIRAVAHPSDDRLIGWSPDGALLLFSSDRKGTIDLWAQPMSDGKPQGPSALLYPDIGEKTSITITSRGSLYLRTETGDSDVMMGAIDPGTGRLTASPVRLASRFVGSNRLPEWSPDGKYLAYFSSRSDAQGGDVIVIYDVATDTVLRELRPKIVYPTWLRWSPDGETLLLSASDHKGRIGVMRVDASSGESMTITTPRDDFFRGFRPEWSPDGRRIYFRNPADDPDAHVVERDLASGAERRIVRRDCDHVRIMVTPDGRSLACPGKNGKAILLHPIDGGEPVELLRAGENERLTLLLQWTNGGRGVLVRRQRTGEQARHEFVIIPLTGDSPITLRFNAPGVTLHPDGRRIAYTVRQLQRDVWVLENVLPKAAAATRSEFR